MIPSSLPPLVRDRLTGPAAGITSVCTAHPLAIEATLRHGRGAGTRVLIEATCNQVNQNGGYTGLTPAGFRQVVQESADRTGFDPARLILGGDHLGPNPWKHRPAADAMRRAATLVEGYARAGFRKLHLDTSMGCAGEPAVLPDETVAARAAQLAAVAERAADPALPPVYVIGTEVPVPGGAREALRHLAVTRPEAALRTVEVHRAAFAAAGLDGAFDRVVGAVVQPGVEFGNAEVAAYRPEAARALSAVLGQMPGLVFEAHSTDYQPDAALAGLVRDGFAILKVGPWLTFALREALYGLDAIGRELTPTPGEEALPAVMERLMLREPATWRPYCEGDADALRVQRHFGLSDRIRYLWPQPEARDAVDRLLARLGDGVIPGPLVSQFLGALHPAVAEGSLVARPRDLLLAAVTAVLDRYARACSPAGA